MFGLTALAAVAAMAFVGASSAMAGDTQLCSSDSSCGGTISVHDVSPAGEPGLLLSSLVNVECDVLYEGTTLGLGLPLLIHGHFLYSNCETFGGSGCTVTQTSASALIKVLLPTGNTEEETEITGEGEVLVECGSFIHCKYKGEGLKGSGLGSLQGAPGTSIEEATVQKVSGFFCPTTSKLHLTTEPLSATYVKT
jgi:hypothetical protein